MSTVQNQNPDQEIGYLRGKCEIYERLFPQILESLMHISSMVIIQREKEKHQENLLSAMFGNLVNMPQFQENMKRAMDQEREKFDKEHSLGRPSI